MNLRNNIIKSSQDYERNRNKNKNKFFHFINK